MTCVLKVWGADSCCFISNKNQKSQQFSKKKKKYKKFCLSKENVMLV